LINSSGALPEMVELMIERATLEDSKGRKAYNYDKNSTTILAILLKVSKSAI
jgi:hypothetical protein